MNVKVATEINDITLGEFQKYDLINIENQEADFLLHKTIEIFCGVDIQLVSKFPLKDATEIGEEIQAVLGQEAPFETMITLNDVKYGFIPDLSKMSLGEYIDLEDALKETKSFHQALAVMYRPVVKEYQNLYTIEPYDASLERQRIMKGAPLGTASAAVVFFYNIAKDLLQASQVYSKELQTESKTIADKLSSLKNMGGLTASTHFLKVVSQSLNK